MNIEYSIGVNPIQVACPVCFPSSWLETLKRRGLYVTTKNSPDNCQYCGYPADTTPKLFDVSLTLRVRATSKSEASVRFREQYCARQQAGTLPLTINLASD